MGAPALSQYVDVTVQPLYDTNTILAAGATNLTYFAQPIGQGTSAFGAAGQAKTLADTNMDLAGQLPSGQNFKILGFRVQPAFSIITADSVSWSAGAWFLFTVGQKPYLRVPVDTLPAGCGVYGSVFGTAATGGVLAHGIPSLNNSFQVGRKQLDLSSTTNFAASLNWLAANANTSTVIHQPAAGIPVRIYLDGLFYRAMQ